MAEEEPVWPQELLAGPSAGFQVLCWELSGLEGRFRTFPRQQGQAKIELQCQVLVAPHLTVCSLECFVCRN